MSDDLSRRTFLTTAAAGAAAMAAGVKAQSNATVKPRIQQTLKTTPGSGYGLHAPKLDVVRLGFIGVGARGPGHIESAMNCEGTQIVAICDNHVPSAEAARKQVTDGGRPAPVLYTKDEHDYKNMLQRDDIDAVIIATPWEWHVPMAVDAMNNGKHAFSEVPAAYTIDDCWKLVETSEKTQKHMMMMENVNYGREELMVMNMCRLGVFGELLHGEAAYIHDLRGQMHEIEHGTGSWRTIHYTKRNGNLYPTHGLGPVSWYMNINRGDRFDYMSSMSCNSRVRAIYAKEQFPEGSIRRSEKFVCGDINTSIVQTKLGKTVMIQWDEQLPRPYSRLNLIQGTKGIWAGFPNRFTADGESESTDSFLQDAGLKAVFEKYDHPLWKKLAETAVAHGGHGGMDYVMMWRIITNLRAGLPMDQDVYDAAAWSSIGPLSEWSVAHRGQSIDIPDFTRGKWESMKPVEITV